MIWLVTLLFFQARQTYVTDVSGNRVATGAGTRQTQTADGASTRTETLQNINGRSVPVDCVEEKVLSDNGTVRVLERLIRRYDPIGNPAESERVRIEETKNADGTKNVNTALYRSDVNGNMKMAERSNSEASKTGDTVTTNTTLMRPAIDGSMRLAERIQGSLVKREDGTSSENVMVYRPNDNGRFVEAERTVTDRQEKKNGEAIEDTTRYQAGDRGALELVGRQISRTEKRTGGAEVKEVTIYGTASPGRYATGTPQIREQQLIEKRATADGAVESFSVRRPDLDSQKLGAYQKVSEQVCAGTCKN